MPDSDTAHLQRDRAESFGAVADLYDRYRPGYPAELIADLLAIAGDGPVLDIGTGTGKAAALLVAAGAELLGVEVDPKMAEVARRHGITVEVGGFETWNDQDRRFALITAAQAWHWVDPVPGAAKVARLLLPGATFAPFWNFEDPEPQARAAMIGVYQELAPELVPANRLLGNRPAERPYVADLERSGAFVEISTRTYPWERAVPLADWIGRIGTHSDHLKLGPERLVALQAAMQDALGALGPDVHTSGGTYSIRATVAR